MMQMNSPALVRRADSVCYSAQANLLGAGRPKAQTNGEIGDHALKGMVREHIALSPITAHPTFPFREGRDFSRGRLSLTPTPHSQRQPAQPQHHAQRDGRGGFGNGIDQLCA